MERLHVYFSGRVQGVFFRATTERVAQSFEVTGWVRNLDDGRVELVAEGEREELQHFLDAIVEAKQNNIDEVDASTGPASGEFEGFRILR